VPVEPHFLRTGEAQTLTFAVTGDAITGGGLVGVPTASQFLYASYVTVMATGFVTLTPTYSWTPLSNHPEIPCYQASGSRTFTITPMSADLTVTPESSSVSPGSMPYVDFRGSPL
jgi:hypothetical protein